MTSQIRLTTPAMEAIRPRSMLATCAADTRVVVAVGGGLGGRLGRGGFHVGRGRGGGPGSAGRGLGRFQRADGPGLVPHDEHQQDQRDHEQRERRGDPRLRHLVQGLACDDAKKQNAERGRAEYPGQPGQVAQHADVAGPDVTRG